MHTNLYSWPSIRIRWGGRFAAGKLSIDDVNEPIVTKPNKVCIKRDDHDDHDVQ